MKQRRDIIPMSVPAIGNGHQQPMFDVSQSVPKKCECGSEHFEKVFRVGLVSKLAPGNKMQQDIIIEIPVYICHNCGNEMNIIDNKD